LVLPEPNPAYQGLSLSQPLSLPRPAARNHSAILDSNEAFSLGAKDFLTKPFDATEVLLRVYNLLETRWLSVQLQEQIKALENPS